MRLFQRLYRIQTPHLGPASAMSEYPNKYANTEAFVNDNPEGNHHYDKIAQAIEYFVKHQKTQPGLAELSQHVGLSEFHFQRVFSQWVGVSPKQYLQYLTKQYAKQCLRNESVMDAALSSGLSGASRLHDLMIRCEGMTPGEIRRRGKGLCIQYGVHCSDFGWCLLAVTARGVCKLGFFDTEKQKEVLVDELFMEWSGADIVLDPGATEPVFEAIFIASHRRTDGSVLADSKKKPLSFNVLLKGSPFQLKVWEALLAIPAGQLSSYQRVAQSIGSPNGARAVASAIAKNTVGYLIPCHRVIRGNGDFSQYRWGSVRKQSMIAWEGCAASEVNDSKADV